jgi:hypothetical protein
MDPILLSGLKVFHNFSLPLIALKLLDCVGLEELKNFIVQNPNLNFICKTSEHLETYNFNG